LGWAVGRNTQIEYRWGAGSVESYRKYANELVALAPDVIVCVGVLTVSALQQVTHSVPIVFLNVTDPVNAGVVESLARPGGNATGFVVWEYGMSGKWLELLKELSPQIARAGVMRNPLNPSGSGQLGGIQAVAPNFNVELRPIDARDSNEIERSFATFAGTPNGGLIVPSQAPMLRHRDLIIALAAQYRLPAVYGDRVFADAGGLLSYGADPLETFRPAAGYVDRILKGEKPADMPVLAPTKYQLVINLKTAKGLNLTIPPSLLARADEVIE
jgi:putative ABC transport system substrate-binding protein